MKLDKVNDAAALTSKGKSGAVPPKKDKVEQDPKDGYSTQLTISYKMPVPGQWGPVQLNGQVVPVLPQPGSKDDPSIADDDDGPAVGGGYEPSNVEVNLPVPTGDGLLWRTSGMPKQTKITGDDGPAVGGGYFTRPFKATNTGSLFEEFIPPEPPTPQKLLPAPKQAEAKTEKNQRCSPRSGSRPGRGAFCVSRTDRSGVAAGQIQPGSGFCSAPGAEKRRVLREAVRQYQDAGSI